MLQKWNFSTSNIQTPAVSQPTQPPEGGPLPPAWAGKGKRQTLKNRMTNPNHYLLVN